MSMDAGTAAPRPLRCSANVTVLFPGMSLIDALDGAARAGFHTVELIDPYQVGAVELAHALRDRELSVDLLNLPMGDFAAGERGRAGDPTQRTGFQADLDRATRVIDLVGTRKVNVLAGRSVEGYEHAAQLDCLVDNLALAVDRLEPAGIRVVTEMLNPWDVPGFLLSSVPTVRDVLARLDGRVRLQLDVYHLQRIQGELLRTIDTLAPLTGHIQVADAPDRSEPGTGEINLRNVLAGIAATGYDDLIGLEYRPSAGCVDPFAWVEEYGLVRA